MKPVAIFTIVKNEEQMLPIWIRYYEQFFCHNDMFILNHQSNDGSIERVPEDINIILIENDFAFDHEWLLNTVKIFQRQLLKEYKTVVFTEIDEILVSDPSYYYDFKDYLMNFCESDIEAICCTGYEIYHDPEKEREINFNDSLFSQRNFWFRRDGSPNTFSTFDKPLISKKPLNWAVGFHSAVEVTVRDPTLFLVHLHRVDYKFCIDRHLHRVEKMNFANDGGGWHQRVKGEELEEFYTTPKGNISEVFPWLKKIPC